MVPNKMVWEKIESDTSGTMYRSRTPTGWLVYEINNVLHTAHDVPLQSGYEWRSAMTFVPDPEGVWLKEIK